MRKSQLYKQNYGLDNESYQQLDPMEQFNLDPDFAINFGLCIEKLESILTFQT